VAPHDTVALAGHFAVQTSLGDPRRELEQRAVGAPLRSGGTSSGLSRVMTRQEAGYYMACGRIVALPAEPGRALQDVGLLAGLCGFETI
jgi:hypothetical protein